MGVQSRYEEGKGDVVLYLGNKNADHALEQVRSGAGVGEDRRRTCSRGLQVTREGPE